MTGYRSWIEFRQTLTFCKYLVCVVILQSFRVILISWLRYLIARLRDLHIKWPYDNGRDSTWDNLTHTVWQLNIWYLGRQILIEIIEFRCQKLNANIQSKWKRIRMINKQMVNCIQIRYLIAFGDWNPQQQCTIVFHFFDISTFFNICTQTKKIIHLCSFTSFHSIIISNYICCGVTIISNANICWRVISNPSCLNYILKIS